MNPFIENYHSHKHDFRICTTEPQFHNPVNIPLLAQYNQLNCTLAGHWANTVYVLAQYRASKGMFTDCICPIPIQYNQPN